MSETCASLPAFRTLAEPILHAGEFERLKSYRQHRNATTYEHSLRVAEACFRFCRHHRIRVDYEKLIRGALLHDYFLYNRHYADRPDYIPVGGLQHLFHHSEAAWRNASRHYPTLSDIEKDIITRHMFPLTLLPPRTREGWLVCLFDKIEALNDYRKNKRKKRG